MPEPKDAPRDPQSIGDDCSLPVGQQNGNIARFAIFWGIFYLSAPVTYIGLLHANLLKELGNNDTMCNIPSAVYLWLSIVPVLTAWFLPHARHVKPLALVSVGAMAAMAGAVAVTLAGRTSSTFTTWMVIGFSAVFGGANGILLTAMWDLLRRGVSTSRRGKALGYTFGVGPLFACLGALVQDALFDGKLLGGHSLGLAFPYNYMTMFAIVAPLLLAMAVTIVSFRLPESAAQQLAASAVSPWREITAGIRQFVHNRSVLYAVVIYVIAYSGGNAILSNISLHAKDVLGQQADTIGVQQFLRFGFKAAAGAGLGWLLATASPRATLVTTTSILLIGLGWALGSRGEWFFLTFGLMGAGELFGAYFPNYVTTASEKPFVRINLAYLSLLSVLVGFSSVAFGMISDKYGRIASFVVAAGMLAVALFLIGLLLPADPTPPEKSPIDRDRA